MTNTQLIELNEGNPDIIITQLTTCQKQIYSISYMASQPIVSCMQLYYYKNNIIIIIMDDVKLIPS